MIRALLLLCLLLPFAPALADDAPAAAADAPVCVKPEGKPAADAEGGSPAAQRPGAPAPARARSRSPRWHSMLPGMIR